MSKYEVGGPQGHYQPGSDDRVLENKLGIIEPVDMDEAELVLLQKLYEDVLLTNLPQASITVADVKAWHFRWLGNVYEWAGQERSVNMAKGDIQFAAAAQIPRLLVKFEEEFLGHYTPCSNFNIEQIIEAIAIVHIEFILIHPFRDGNGRLSRLLSDVMAVQAGLQPLDYSSWDQNKDAYFSAISRGMGKDYETMKDWVNRAVTSAL